MDSGGTISCSRRITVLGAISVIGVTSGCLGDAGSDSDDSDDAADDVEDFDIAELEIIDRSTDEVVATYHGHWHGELPTMSQDEHLSIGARILTEDDEIPIGSAETLQLGARSVTEEESMLEFESHGDHVHIHASSHGEEAIIMQLLNADTVLWETTDSITILVE